MTIKLPERYRSLDAQLRSQGWDPAELTAGSHVCWRSPSGDVVVAAGSPSDRHARHRLVSALRAAGALIDGRGTSREDTAQDDSGQPDPVQEPPPPSVLTDLTGQIKRAQAVLSDLRAETKIAEQARKEIQRLTKADVADLVLDEVARQLQEFGAQDIVRTVMDTFRSRADAELREFAGNGNRLIREYGRAVDARIAEANDLLGHLHRARATWEDRLDVVPVPPVPPAFRNGQRGLGRCSRSPPPSSQTSAPRVSFTHPVRMSWSISISSTSEPSA